MPFLRPTIFALLLWSTAALAAPALVAVDVGHGVKDSGALSARGRPEFEFNQVFAGVLADALRSRQLGVAEINFAGDIGSLAARPAQARGSDFFISIHHDSISEAWLQFWDWDGREASYTEVKRGYGIFVSAQNPDLSTSLRCASTIGAMLRRAGFVPSTWHGRRHLAADAENGVWYYDNLVVLYRTTLPAVLFEAGVIKHREEELELRDPERQARMADAVATGIAACLSVREISVPASDPPQTSP
ncbi:N-acetylmuramoyl-L-alanine amidase [Dechloromonas denitrificans]|uniref:N-acetylmuramoyl-L-alanine amidase n=1 Tax=Dechloromonas denitrificans TaxID=281362 RepID=A0A133XES4_9RHOO|nr:N-acetylmuramoyl-L-alanine amidase [Dechloromonas denitrificans]KXB29399.1 N-acetylmuramoyl-L-alanine amidase [Dechloromonas denitrificans]